MAQAEASGSKLKQLLVVPSSPRVDASDTKHQGEPNEAKSIESAELLKTPQASSQHEASSGGGLGQPAMQTETSVSPNNLTQKADHDKPIPPPANADHNVEPGPLSPSAQPAQNIRQLVNKGDLANNTRSSVEPSSVRTADTLRSKESTNSGSTTPSEEDHTAAVESTKVHIRGRPVVVANQKNQVNGSPMHLENNQRQEINILGRASSPNSMGGNLANDSSLATSSTNSYQCILVLALPFVSCVILLLLFYLIVQYCRKLSRFNKDKQTTASGSKLISNNTLKGLQIFKSRTSKRSPLDERQLTIYMESESSGSNDDNHDVKQNDMPPNSRRSGRDIDQVLNKKVKSSSSKSSGSKKSAPRPQLNYGLNYDFSQSILTVTIKQARDLPGLDLCGSSDPYVKVCLMPNENRSAIYKTKIHKKTLNPVFNETFQFKVAYGELNNRTLVLSCYDYDRFSRHDEIGQISIPIGAIDLSQAQEQWSELIKTTRSVEGQLGDICISLRYVPTAGRLNVVVLEARQLKKMDVAGLSDPYVKLTLVDSSGKRLKKKKTSIKKCTLNPHYNESFSFEIPFDQVQKVRLIVTVIDYDRIGTSEPIGRIVLGCDSGSGEQESRHWMDMLASPRRPIAQWHGLKELEQSHEATSRASKNFIAKP